MNRAEKTKLAEDLKEKFSQAPFSVFADYKGLTAVESDELRAKLRDVGAETKVVKNNVIRLAVKDGSLGEDAKTLVDGLVGPTLVVVALKDAAATAKAIFDFSKDHEALDLKDSLLEKKKITPSDIEALAKLPSKDVLLSMLLSTFQGPSRSFVSVLAAVPRSLVNVLSAVEKKKAEDGGA